MILYTGEYEGLKDYIKNEKSVWLVKNAIYAAKKAGAITEEYDDYAVIKIEELYNVAYIRKIIYIEGIGDILVIDDFVVPFDEDDVYDLKLIDKRIRYRSFYNGNMDLKRNRRKWILFSTFKYRLRIYSNKIRGISNEDVLLKD